MRNLENLRIRVRLVNNEKYFLKHVSKPTFIYLKPFDKNYAKLNQF